MLDVVRMANDIARFHESFPESEAVKMFAEHINKFWPPMMRERFFDVLGTEGDQFRPLVVKSSHLVRCEKHNPINVDIDKSGTGG